jgi:hypothetical protein
MDMKLKIHVLIVLIINSLLVLLMVIKGWYGNDKSIILFIFGYPLLMILNGLAWLILKLSNKPENKIYKWNTIGLFVLFLAGMLVARIM